MAGWQQGCVVSANLSKPFAESCCDGGASSLNDMSCQPCGCDPGLRRHGVVVGYLCERHKPIAKAVKDFYAPKVDHFEQVFASQVANEQFSTRGNQVILVGHYGGDEAHAASAWASTGGITDVKRLRIPAMLKSLAKDGHHTPFEKSMLHFLVICDTASHIHIIKHRIGVSVNAESARYKELTEDKFLIPQDWPDSEADALYQHCLACFGRYHETLERLTPTLGKKRAKESARYYLPYASQLTLDVSFNFRSFMHFQGLRNSDHAQFEIAGIAKEMLRLVKDTGDFKYSLEGFGYGT